MSRKHSLITLGLISALAGGCDEPPPPQTPGTTQPSIQPFQPGKPMNLPPSAPAFKPVEWKEHRFADGAYSLQIPASPTCQDTPGNPLGAHTCFIDTERSGLMFGYSRLPAPATAETLAATMENSAKALNGRIYENRDIAQNGMKGKEYAFKNAEGIFRARIFAVSQDIVQIMGTIKVDESTARQEIALYLDSLMPVGASR